MILETLLFASIAYADLSFTAGVKIDLFDSNMDVMVMDGELSKAMAAVVEFQKTGNLQLAVKKISSPGKKANVQKKIKLHSGNRLPGSLDIKSHR